jgi:hypothetical protein
MSSNSVSRSSSSSSHSSSSSSSSSGSCSSSSCSCSHSDPTLAQIKANATVVAALAQAWTDSNPNAPDVPPNPPPSLKKEQGGWILWNCVTNAYRVIRVPAGTRDGLATIVGTRPSPARPEKVVAWFHTHPNTTAEGYTTGASPGDIGFTNSEAKVPGIIREHGGVDTDIPYPSP